MAAKRFPPLFSPPSITAGLMSAIVVLAGLFLLGNASPFWLMVHDPASQVALVVLIVMAFALFVGLYLLAAPLMWGFTKRYTPSAQGQQHLPEHLIAACLAGIDLQCPRCTYNLRGLKGSTCPECSAPVIVYLYGAQRISTRWTASIICWLALSLIASAITVGACWEPLNEIINGRLYGGASRYVILFVVLLVAFVGLAVCVWRAILLAVPKPPHKQSICARQTAIVLAVINAACTLAVSVVLGWELLSRWY